MSLGRREFLGALGAAAAAATARETAALVASGVRGRASRIVVFRQPGFQSSDGGCDAASLDIALAGLDVRYVGLEGLGHLAPGTADLLLLPYGSAFPKEAWPDILGFLADGGNLLVVGGVPFAVPLWRPSGETWSAETRQANYHKRLGLTHANTVATPQGSSLDASGLGPATVLAGLEVGRTFAGYWRFTRTKSVPSEDGSDGEREAVLTPLVTLTDAGGAVLAAPVVQVDRLAGPFAGGRWIFAMYDGTVPASLLRALVERGAAGVRRLEVRASFASYHEGETPAVEATLRGSPAPGGPCRIEVFDAAGHALAAASLALPGEGAVRSARADLRPRRGGSLAPGFYRLEARCGDLAGSSGFWVGAPALLAGGTPFTTDAHTLLQDGRPYPVTGTTYMASDVHRRFLFEPNPLVWDRDFAAMKAAGATMVRTGIWTAWRRYMPEPGHVDEGALRAFEAFVLTARRHDIPVIFTFFAFLPEAWGGLNAYLDPAAVRAQQAFVTAFAERARLADDVLWDLINEPSFCNPRHLWSCRPNGDPHEQAAWAAWLRETYPATSDAAFALRMAERWRMVPGESLDLPPLEEFGDRNLWEDARPLRTTSYRLFAQAMFARWARTMAQTLRAINPRQLVMVGQDEGGTGESPSNHVFGEHMDVTCIHTWWLNDDLVWDHVVTKTPGRPNLAQETGVMFVETLDGRSWRTEDDARDLLERKLAIALGVGAAGYLEWIWNVNTTMPLDNEATIGLRRADGSAKPEFAAWRSMNRFGAALRDVGPRERESVVMVIPHAHLWSSRSTAAEATKRAVRAMAYHCRTPLAGVSELALTRLGQVPKLLLVPAPRVLTQAAWDALGSLASAGATVLLTGPCDADEYWLPAARVAHGETRPVSPSEDLRIGEAIHRLSFRGDRPTRVEKADVGGDAPPAVQRLALAGGTLLWSPLPVELASEVEPTAALYRWALASAGVAPLFAMTSGDDAGVLVWPALYRDAVLYTFASERARPTAIRLTDRTSGAVIDATVPAGRAAMVLVERGSGREIRRLGAGGQG